MILYKGKSRIDGNPIVCVATGIKSKSANEKTGDMIQLWILRSDIEPPEAQKTGNDYSVCGNCPLRPSRGGGCYVNTGQAPLAVYRAFKRGSYETRATDVIGCKLESFTKEVRLGAYGDLAALPTQVVTGILKACKKGFTGYTHDWKKSPHLSSCCMASVHSYDEKIQAEKMGFRTFRTVADASSENLAPNEIECPSDRGVQCKDCKLCNGFSGAKSIAIEAHGSGAKKVKELQNL